jgi:hypothetical protein
VAQGCDDGVSLSPSSEMMLIEVIFLALNFDLSFKVEGDSVQVERAL